MRAETSNCRAGASVRRLYFAFECKRLRIPYDQGVRANADEYVGDDGMMCFITGKYSKWLPSAGMIGYIIDGDTADAIRVVGRAVVRKADSLKLLVGTGLGISSLLSKKR